jgi:hypothetical protein
VAEAETALQAQGGRLLLRYSGTEPKIAPPAWKAATPPPSRSADADSRGEEHVNFPCLNPLNVANIQISKLCQLLLGHSLANSLPADIVS